MTTTSAGLVELGPDDDLFPGWCGVWAATELLDHPHDPPRPVSAHRAHARTLLTPGGSRTGVCTALVADGAVVGALRVVLPLRDNLSSAQMELAVDPASRRRGIGSALLAEAVRQAVAHGRSDLIAEVDEPRLGMPGVAFARRHGFSCDLVETRRELVLPVEEARLAALEAQGSPDDTIVTWRDHTPDELLADRAMLEHRMSTDAPMGELPWGEEQWDPARLREYEARHVVAGEAVLSAGAVHDGRLVAFTDLHVPLACPELADQGATLVLAEHRGRRLGARVKVAVLREVQSGWPQVHRISTYNKEDNRPMVAVNEALGFVPVGRLSAWSRRV